MTKPQGSERIKKLHQIARLIEECRDDGFSPADTFDIFVSATVAMALSADTMTRKYFQARVLEAFDEASVIRLKKN